VTELSKGSTPPGPERPAERGDRGRAPTLRTPLTELTGVRYPVVQTGMGYVAYAPLVAATANAGGLGFIGSGAMTFDELERAIKDVKEQTDQPFGVNFRADAPDAAARVDLIIREGIRVAGTALAPKRELIQQAHDAGVVVIPSIGAKRHAQKVAEWGVDAVLVQGGEGGGHTGPIPTTVLLPQVVDAVSIPVIGAGGFHDGRGLVAALSWGACGVAMGTRFLISQESPVPQHVKERYLAASATDTVVTTKVDGVPNRVLRSPFVDQLESTTVVTALPRAVRNAFTWKKISGTSWKDMVKEGLAMKGHGDVGWLGVIQAANTPILYRSVMVEGDVEHGVMSSGQAVGAIDDLPTVDALIQRIMWEAHDVLERLRGIESVPIEGPHAESAAAAADALAAGAPA
jgi:NAD(P)H-dependent flavin oxidoreductase YrpB (nitropropane dioxygenase family)